MSDKPRCSLSLTLHFMFSHREQYIPEQRDNDSMPPDKTEQVTSDMKQGLSFQK